MDEDIGEITVRLQNLLSRVSSGRTVSNPEKLASLDKLLLETSSALRSCRNYTAPINRLPHEILSLIFGLCCLQQFAADYPRHLQRTYRSARVLESCIMPVCKLWRDVALSTGTLWSDIAILDPHNRLLASHLSRSQSTTLNIYSECTTRGSVARIVNAHPDRVRIIHIQEPQDSRPPQYDLKDTLNSLPKAAPHIEEVAIHAHVWPRAITSESSIRIFSGCAPRLRVLSLFQAPFMPADQFPNLRQLYIATHHLNHLSDILTILRGAPLLEEVYIRLRLADSPKPMDGSLLPMTRLHKMMLHLSDNPIHLISRLSIPPTCLIRLEALEVEEVSACLSLLSNQLTGSPMKRLSFTTGPELISEGYADAFYVTLCNDSADSGVVLGVLCDYDYNDRRAFGRILSDIFRTNPLCAHIREMSVFSHRDLLNTELLSSLPSLATINHIFSTALYKPHNPDSRRATRTPILAQRSTNGTLPCPSLTTLYFIECGADEIRDALRILQFRRQQGRPIARLGVHCSAELKEQAFALREHVPDLDVAFMDSADHDERMRTFPDGGWREHAARARVHWPQWPAFGDVQLRSAAAAPFVI